MHIHSMPGWLEEIVTITAPTCSCLPVCGPPCNVTLPTNMKSISLLLNSLLYSASLQGLVLAYATTANGMQTKVWKCLPTGTYFLLSETFCHWMSKPGLAGYRLPVGRVALSGLLRPQNPSETPQKPGELVMRALRDVFMHFQPSIPFNGYLEKQANKNIV